MGGIGLVIMTMAAGYVAWLFIQGSSPKNFRECVTIVVIGLVMAILGAVVVLPYDLLDTLALRGASFLQIAVVVPGYVVVFIGLLGVGKLILFRTSDTAKPR